MKKLLLFVLLPIFAVAGFSYWYIPRKLKTIIQQKLNNVIATRGFQLSKLDINLGWNSIELDNLELQGENLRITIKEIQIDNYQLTSILPLKIKLGKITLNNTGIKGDIKELKHKSSNFSNFKTPTYSGGSISWNQIALNGVWLNISSKQGKIICEDGQGHFTKKKGGKIQLENLALDSSLIPVYFIDTLNLEISPDRKVKRATMKDLTWNLSKKMKLYTGYVELEPDKKHNISFQITGKILPELGKIKTRGYWNHSSKKLSGKVLLTDFKPGTFLPKILPLPKKENLQIDSSFKFLFTPKLVSLKGTGSLDKLRIYHKLVSTLPLKFKKLSSKFALSYNRNQDKLQIKNLEIEHKFARALAKGEITNLKSKKPIVTTRIEVPEIHCNRLKESIPAGFIPHLSQFKLSGALHSKIRAKINFADISKKTIELSGNIPIEKCNVLKAPPYFRSSRIKNDFDFEIIEPGGQSIVVEVSQLSDWFTPLDQISKYMVKAVLTTEDSRFWRHRGYIPSEFSSALARNLKAGKFKWGASSITMQIVKNVFLKRRKTIARKLEELFLTSYIEKDISKRRLMEIYLNIVELGPDIYGITKAAMHYFGKNPANLSIREAIFFASILPSPKKRYRYYCQGKLSSFWKRHLKYLLGVMKRRKHITEEEYQQANEEELQFDHFNFLGKNNCYRKIRKYTGN
ncbi:MAG: transglycosylase domain-containing protein [Myxococcota bacterium]